MKYALHVRKHKGVSLPRTRVWNIGEFGGTIGRSVDCDCVLEDESRFISRRQARVSVDSEYVIQWRQEGGNPSLINGEAVQAGQTVRLKQGDHIVIGEYQLQLELDEKADKAIPIDWNEPARNVRRPEPSAEMLAQPLIADGDALQTIDDLLGTTEPAQEEALPARSLDDWDPLGHAVEMPLERPAAGSLGSTSSSARPSGAGSSNPGNERFMQSEAEDVKINLDLESLLDLRPVAAESALPGADLGADVVAAAAELSEPPAVLASGSLVAGQGAGSASTPSAHRAGEGLDLEPPAILQALKEGLGLNAEQSLTPDQVRLIGTMTRSALNGVLALMSHRSMTRRELRTEMTTMLPRDNNPLKYCPNASEALRRLLSPPEAGYMGPVESIEQGLAELLSHQQGLMEALHQGFSELGKDFCPESIKEEARQNRRWPIGSGPLWQTYESRYRQRFKNGPDQFESALGEVFRHTLDSVKMRPAKSGES